MQSKIRFLQSPRILILVLLVDIAFSTFGTAGSSTASAQGIPIAAPVNLTFERVDEYNIRLSWDDPGNPSGSIDGYYIFKDGNVLARQDWYQPRTFGDGESTCGITRSFMVMAFKGEVESDPSNTVNVPLRACLPPSLTVPVVSQTDVTLAWNDTADRPGGIDGYRVYRNGIAMAVVTGGGIGYIDRGLNCSTSYSYMIRAYRGDVEFDPSNMVDVTTQACPPPDAPPAPASQVEATESRDFGVLVNWTGSLGATYYEVWRHTSDSSASASLIAEVADPTPSVNFYVSYSDYSASWGNMYYYWVKACNSNGCSSFSTPDSGYRGTMVRRIGDFNGDGKADVAVFRPSNGTWYISTLGDFHFGEPGDIPVVGDYNGDGRDDVAVFRPSNGTWYISTRGNFIYGEQDDIPVPADYNGDGRDDIAVYRPSNGTWYISTLGDFHYGESGDIPVPGDYNGDGRDDVAVFRPSNRTWYISTLGDFVYDAWGFPVPGDYNGDGRDEIVVYTPYWDPRFSYGWYISTLGHFAYGDRPGDIPVPGDYNGDGRMDIAIYRPGWVLLPPYSGSGPGTWYISTLADFPFGEAGDIPV